MSPIRSNLTRCFHLAVLAIVVHQLLTSTIMERPSPGDDPGWPYTLHTWIGATGLVVLTLFWLWTLRRSASETPLSQLVPWFSLNRLRMILREVAGAAQSLLNLRLPSLQLPALSSAVHGLGLLLATFLGASGAAWMFGFNGTRYGRTIVGLHELAGNVMWAYLVGHAAMALLHQALGDRVMSRMFWLGKEARRSALTAE